MIMIMILQCSSNSGYETITLQKNREKRLKDVDMFILTCLFPWLWGDAQKYSLSCSWGEPFINHYFIELTVTDVG